MLARIEKKKKQKQVEKLKSTRLVCKELLDRIDEMLLDLGDATKPEPGEPWVNVKRNG